MTRHTTPVLDKGPNRLLQHRQRANRRPAGAYGVGLPVRGRRREQKQDDRNQGSSRWQDELSAAYSDTAGRLPTMLLEGEWRRWSNAATTATMRLTLCWLLPRSARPAWLPPSSRGGISAAPCRRWHSMARSSW